MNIRILTSSDEHLSDTNPGFRKDNYKNAILNKLAYQGELGQRAKVDCLVRAGDFFHHKSPSRTSHSTITSVAKIHQSYGFPTYALAGNHDMIHNDLESVDSVSPLGVLLNTGIFKNVNGVVLDKGSRRCRLVGIDYDPNLNIEKISNLCAKSKQDDVVIAFVHCLSSMAPSEKMSEFFHEPIFDYRDLVYDGCPDVYVFGHYHKDQGVQEHLGVKFINLGSVGRGALTFETLERKPKSGIITINTTGVEVEEVILDNSDPSEIFDIQRKEQINKERKHIKEFVDQLRNDSSVASISDFKDSLNTFPDDVRKMAMEIIEAAESGVLDE